MPFSIIKTDITELAVDAIVNAANKHLQMGGGVCGAIFKAAGERQLQAECNRLAPIDTGEAVLTQGYNLHAKYIIHAVGPIYRGGNEKEEELLRSCYISALTLAVNHGCESIAFPLISSGVYGYPKTAALHVATEAILEFTKEHDINVFLVLFDKSALSPDEELRNKIQRYIDENFFDESAMRGQDLAADSQLKIAADTEESVHSGDEIFLAAAQEVSLEAEPVAPQAYFAVAARKALDKKHSIDDAVENLEDSFSTALLRLIDKAGKSDSEIYHRANIDRRLFSKIRSNENYTPSKATVLAFAIALELNLDGTADLLARAGFALSHSRKFDVIVQYFIENARYDVFEINEVLFSYDQPLLGG